MNQITTVLLGLLLILLILLILPSASCRSPQVISEDDYTFIAIVYSEIIGDEDPKHLIRNLDGTPFDTLDMKAEYNLTPYGNPRLSGKIVLFDPTEICYHFFCKKPEEGKPLQILIGGEWKLIEYRAGVWVHNTQDFFTSEILFSPPAAYGEELPIAFYPTPKEDPTQRITLKQDEAHNQKDFFIRDIQGEWMKVELWNPDLLIDDDELYKQGNQPTYWVRWRNQDKILFSHLYFNYYSLD